MEIEPTYIDSNWKDVQAKNPNKIYTIHGKNYSFSKKEKFLPLSSLQRIAGITVGLFLSCVTLGSILIFSKSVRELFTGRQVLRVLTETKQKRSTKSTKKRKSSRKDLSLPKKVIYPSIQDLAKATLFSAPSKIALLKDPKIDLPIDFLNPIIEKEEKEDLFLNPVLDEQVDLPNPIIEKEEEEDLFLNPVLDEQVDLPNPIIEKEHEIKVPQPSLLLDPPPEAIKLPFYDDIFIPSVEPIAEITKITPAPKNITHPIDHLISINSHGSYVDEIFDLPENVYILVPHPNGLENPYILNSLPNNITFEEVIYNRKDGQIPLPSSGGWFVYKPREKVRNLRLSPWIGNDANKEFENWKTRVPSEDSLPIQSAGAIPNFADVPARDRFSKKLSYHNIEKTKIKIFGVTNLKEVVLYLVNKNPGQPLILAPFTCNANSSQNKEIDLSMQQVTEIATLF